MFICFGKTWPEVNSEIYANSAEPPDERHIRKIIDRYMPIVMQKWRRDLRKLWLEGAERRKKESIERNKRKGKGRPLIPSN